MKYWLVIAAVACGSDTTENVTPAQEPAKTPDTTPRASALEPTARASHRQEEGWGAVFWRDGQAWKVGGGSVVVSPKSAAAISTQGEVVVCGGVAVQGAPSRSGIALPEGATVPDIKKAPAIRAHLVERAAWRLDEVLPPRDRFTPQVDSIQPAKQRGIDVGSVVKTRRYGAPPILIATGVRSCTGALAIVDDQAERVLAYDRIENACSPLRVIPAMDLDGDSSREFAVFGDDSVSIYRLNETPGNLSMTKLADWRCKKP